MSALKAYHIEGEPDENFEPHMVEGTVSSSTMLRIAHDYNTTIGILCVAVYIKAAIKSMSIRQKSKPVVVSVPVNLRQFFRSDTARNFFGVINIVYYAKDYDGKLESITVSVKEQFEKQLQPDNIGKTMNSYASLEHNMVIRMFPLFIKDPCIRFFDIMAKRGVTSTISNLGQIKMPDELVPYINKFSAFMTASNQQICLSSFGDNLVFGEASPNRTHPVLLNFFRELTSMGLNVELSTNDYDIEL
jgi:hypothetical protein